MSATTPNTWRSPTRPPLPQAKEPTWCNASWLVKIDPEKGTPGKFLRGSELKLVEKKEEEEDGKKVVTYLTMPTDGIEPVVFATDPFVVLDADGNPVMFDPNDAENPVVRRSILC
ncbi:MAG: hypothetical protein MZV65_35935 [Chromatiales bacterium]|nr:hypothetical protein [Chromatiales bacterium]